MWLLDIWCVWLGWIWACQTQRCRFCIFIVVVWFCIKDCQASAIWSHATISAEKGDHVQQARAGLWLRCQLWRSGFLIFYGTQVNFYWYCYFFIFAYCLFSFDDVSVKSTWFLLHSQLICWLKLASFQLTLYFLLLVLMLRIVLQKSCDAFPWPSHS